MQTLVDSKSTISDQCRLKADKYDTSDFLPRTFLTSTRRRGSSGSMRWNVSNPVLFYTLQRRPGPGSIPTSRQTLDEVKEYAQKIKAAGNRTVLSCEPYLLEFLYAEVGL